MNASELRMRRRNVKAFIKADPVEIVISRPQPPTKTPAGGMLPSAPRDMPSQEARIVLNKRRYFNGIIDTEAGDIPHTDYLLVAEHTKDFQVDDQFVWLDEHYRITGRYIARQESILCSIDLLGEPNRS